MPALNRRRATALGILLMLALLGSLAAPPAQAQEFGRIEETKTNTAYFYYAQPGEATVQVYVWGTAQAGIYEIPDGTSLRRLLTMSGGVGRSPRQEGQKPPRIVVRLYRPEQSRETPLLETEAQNILQGTADAPPLREDDILVVETIQRSSFTWRDGLSITSTLLSFTLLVLRILRFRD